MSDATDPFGFGRFVPGFDFLQNLSQGKTPGGQPMQGMPGMPSWVAPTLDVEEIEKRIQELKSVQFWLDQNATALKATVQALEVQKMTLAALRGMNFSIDDMAEAFKAKPPANPFADVSKPITPAPAASPRPHEPVTPERPDENDDDDMPPDDGPSEPEKPATASAKNAAGKSSPTAAGVVDPMQWWGALTEQFQHIAGSAMKDAGLNAASGPFANAFAPAAASGAPSKASANAPKAAKPAASGKRKAASKAGTKSKSAPRKTSSAARKSASRKSPGSGRTR